MKKPFDFLIVGSGLFGSVFAHQMQNAGKSCMVIDKRNHLGGNVRNQTVEQIITHQYGAHIFHTNNLEVWQFINRFASFHNYKHQVKLMIDNKLFSFPINVNTLQEWYQIADEQAAIQHFNAQKHQKRQYNNLEEMAIGEMGAEIYTHFIKDYTEKQWNKDCVHLPCSILARIPIRMNKNEDYFEDKYQGIPVGGYNPIIDQLLQGILTKTDTDFFENRAYWETQAEQIVYTGCIDELFDYRFGALEYRSLRFENEVIDKPLFQPHAVVNYPSKQYDFTRIIEHKHFHPSDVKHTVITKEYPQDFNPKNEPYYPIVDLKNKATYQQYALFAKENNYILGGRLAEFQYYDMHQVIASALAKSKQLIAQSQ